ncbi:acetyltransferase (GNAT) family protein [Solirubrobacter pauli]|uniref:Acetyltransferase (GNAT) family protein n=1 Tax=Solirubrobacter pauli TaxID=166793 RepID=A0A660L8W3_9ACTN|nr:GNAT family N-acetyltransferase [Solirubrobacter pauli]RKQ90959.1 acetyltransferase (GNAT) family protein [Solirubrobacter pauli]
MITRLGVDDAGELLTVQRAAYVGESMVYDQFLPPLTETLDEVRAVLARDDAVVLGLREHGRLLGAVRVMPSGEVARLCVAPDRQGDGVGTALLRAAIAAGGTWLFTGDRSLGNLRLYEKHGFTEQRREPFGDHNLVFLSR